MTPTYRVTLIALNADVSAVTNIGERHELTGQTIDDVIQLSTRLLAVDTGGSPKLEPGIIFHRNERSYRIATHQGRLRVHKSASSFDDYWTANTPEELVDLPPFQSSGSAVSSRSPVRSRPPGGKGGPMRSILEVAGLFALTIVLVAVGLRFGFPNKRFSDVPEDITLITSTDEKAAIFAAVAGTYSSGKTAGNTLVVIKPDGFVTIGAIGTDGKATIPRLQEQARAGRRGSIACVITSFGIISGIAPPDTVNVGRFQYTKAPVTAQ